MKCFRNGCDNIMCDLYLEKVGYICNDCQKEFLIKKGTFFKSKSSFFKKLIKFMDTEKVCRSTDFTFDGERYFNDKNYI